MSIFSSRLTYGDFRRTGVQDCQNAIDYDDFDYPDDGSTPEQIVAKAFAEWEADGMKEQWLEQQDGDFDDLDPDKCYESWKAGWMGRAEGYVAKHLADLKRDREDTAENPADDPFYVDDGSGSLVPEHANFEAALDDALTRVMRGSDAEVKIVSGNEHEGFADVATVMPLDQYNGRHAAQLHEAEAIVIIDEEAFVPRDFEPGYMMDIEYGRVRGGGKRDSSTVAFTSLKSEMTTNPPKHWWRRAAPAKNRICYRTKIEALTKFLEVNHHIVENYGGADYKVSPSEFDAINHKYDLTGKRAVRTIAEAVWAAMPMGQPYCLDRIDLDALNDTSPAREAGAAFVLPDYVYAAQMAAEEAAHYAPVADVSDIPEPDWVTEHLREPRRVFPPLPTLEGPMRMHLQRRDSAGGQRGVETYQMHPPLPPQPEVKPMRVELEEQEPGVSTFRFSNPGKARGRASNRVSIKVVYTGAKYDDNDFKIRDLLGEWHTGSGTDFESGEVDHTARVPETKLAETVKRLKKIKGVKQVENLTEKWAREEHENPAWVTKIIAKHYVKLEEQVPSKWLPKLTATKVQGGKLVAAMKEYGCGAYGCVLPTLDPAVVLKLTTDSTEAEFAHSLAGKLSSPIVVKYHLTRELPDKYKKRDTFLLWRDSAEHVDKVEQTIAEEGGTDPVVVEEAIAAQHKAAQDAFDALYAGKDAKKLLQKWEDACREMGLLVPELSELAEGMITNLHNDKVFFGDVHSGNIGMVNGRWVVVDPGHVAVLEE